MLKSLALIFIFGIVFGGIFEKIKLPRLIGMLLTGILLGPYVLNLLDNSILSISADLRQLALIIILIKAGLSLNIADFKKIGRTALLMCFVPACFEIAAITFFGPMILKISYTQALLMGAVLAAVSPAVVVPKMVTLIEQGYGTDKSIPQMILAGSSMDDVFVIVLFTSFLGMQSGEAFKATSLLNVPISIVTGIFIGVVFGIVLAKIFEHIHLRDSIKVVILLGISCSFIAIEDIIKDFVPFSGLLAVISMAIMIRNNRDFVAVRLSERFSKLWVAAEIVLFVLVGAAVNIKYALKSGIGVIILILVALIIRSIGVLVCMIKTNLNLKERVFCALAYIPKATVQAAIGGVPLAMGLACGDIILTVAVVSIIITAPIGAFLIDFSYKKLLNKE